MKAYVSIGAIYRNEAHYLPEWLEFHRLMGVERFFLYNNRSTDNHLEVLAPYIEEGSVVWHDWPMFPGQYECYEHIFQTHRDDARWIAYIDLDEFMFSPTGARLADVLPEYERWPGVGVNWAQFGTSGHDARPDGLVLESYVRRADALGYNRWIKSVVDPRRVRNFCLAHFFIFTGEPSVVVDENHRPIDGKLSSTEEVSFSKLRVNHYVTKSEEEFQRKLARPRVDNGRPRNFTPGRTRRMIEMTNAVEDRTIQMHLPALKEALGQGRPVRPV